MDKCPLPQLRGTPKQVAWTESIRARFVSLMDRHEAECEARIEATTSYQELHERNLAEQRRIFAGILAVEDAAFWIDRRGMTVDQLAHDFWRASQKPVAVVRRERKPPLH